MVLCVRPCSQTTRLSCVAEGGPFFAAAAPAGARAPLKTIERYVFLKVRRAGAPVPGGRESLIFFDLLSRLRIGRKMKHFVPSRDGVTVASFDAGYFFFSPLLSSIPCFSIFQGAAAAAAGRGSPPPPRAAVASVWVETGGESCVFETHRETRQEREGAGKTQVTSPRPPGPPRSRGMAKMGGPGCVEMLLSL